MGLYQVNLVKLYGQDDTIITIQEAGDSLGMVHVSTVGDYYGKLNFSMDPEEAKIFANSIIQQADYLIGKR